MEYLYLERELSVEDIADKFDTFSSVITRWLHRHEIETRPQIAPSGEDSNFWMGGISDQRQLRPGEWSQKEKARRRDQCRCQKCGADYRAYGRDPDVHHIMPERAYDEDEDTSDLDNLENLITLCRACHKHVEKMAPLLPEGIR